VFAGIYSKVLDLDLRLLSFLCTSGKHPGAFLYWRLHSARLCDCAGCFITCIGDRYRQIMAMLFRKDDAARLANPAAFMSDETISRKTMYF